MDFNDVIGQKHIKSHLKTTVAHGRIPHAQLFVGQNGTGPLPMALAYAAEVLCNGQEIDDTEKKKCLDRVKKVAHPDLHFVLPVNTNDSVKKHAVSSLFLDEWRKFVDEQPYGSLFQWLQQLGIENKQGMIKVDEAADLLKNLSLKSHDGGYKVAIIWMADRMNTECANKILKLVEEPPSKTVLILITEDQEQILGTIRSRCQELQFPKLSEHDIANALVQKRGISESVAVTTAQRASGDFQRALLLLEDEGDMQQFEQWFVSWVRTAFKAKGNKKAIHSLLDWSDDLAREGRETQKKFLHYCIDVFRQALLKNYKADALMVFQSMDGNFALEKFAPFVHQNNIFEITQALEDAMYHIERNGNAKIIFTDMSIQLTRLIHRKP
ncbi:MAG: DNA polymerase III subunit delta' [Marinirhabdus sp.]|nr:DNA polymerase III subunit delta' [Marinirhabdus sp.]